MKRPIINFSLDDEEHWIATLSCGHAQHTRHNPPLAQRPWVLTAKGRDAMLGTLLDCVRCDRFEMPDGHAPYQETPRWTEETVPKSLLKDHASKAGVWALVHVVEGRVEYFVEPPAKRHALLTPQSPGVALPEVLHHVVLEKGAVFYVEFWKASQDNRRKRGVPSEP
jgi:tellurite resistance-related uncharacterized protein